jgi:hypothetical protein
MPPTVKSLEERIDDMALDMGSLKHQFVAHSTKLDLLSSQFATITSQLATLIATQSATQNQLAVTVARLDGAVDQLKSTDARMDATNARIDAGTLKLDAMAADYSGHKSKAETMFAFSKWIGAFVAGVFLTVLLAAFTVVRTAGGYESTIQLQQKTLEEIKRDVSEIRNKQK